MASADASGRGERDAGNDGPAPGRGPRSGGSSAARAVGWTLVLVLLGYAYLVHQGVGAPPGGMARPDAPWYEPSRFLLDRAAFAALVDRPVLGIVLLALPAAVGALGVFWATRSAVARWLAVSSIVAVALFAFYGLVAARIWDFFGWRGSLVMVLTALCVGGAAAAPTLARSWLERSWPVRILLYVPVFLAVVALERQPTGTDEALAFNFSPWPAVPIFGLEMGAYVFIGLWLGLGAGLAVVARARHDLVALAGIAFGVSIPVAWTAARFDGLGWAPLLAVAVVAGVAGGLATLAPREARSRRLLRRAGVMALGGLLAGLPLLTGRAWADADFAYTRHVRAQQVIDSLARYYQREEEYPETLDALVEAGDLERIPRPRIGFALPYELGWAEPVEFSYQSFGSGYILEFDAPEWVQCAYNPPWEDTWDEDGDDEDGDEPYAEDTALGEAWSCPESRPDLW